MNATKPLLTRKDIALMLGVTPRQVKRNEVRWGLRNARSQLNTRPLLYLSAKVLVILKNLQGIE